jgi:predicted Zn-dependent peptidase
MEFIKLINSNGGQLNGSTRFDFTNYFEILPSHKMETALWAEADRMRGLAITQENLVIQQGVVKNEVKVNVLNRPYGGFPWLDLPQYANTNWHNAHNFYGDLADLEAASLADAQAFYDTYYVPSNAVVVVTGAVDPAATLAQVKKHFGELPARPRPELPDFSEPRQTAEKRKTLVDERAPRPALAVAWHMPPRRTPEATAMMALQEILSSGRDSLLHEALVLRGGYTDRVASAINTLGNAYNYEGPILYTAWLFHDAGKEPDEILGAIDAEVQTLIDAPVDAAALDRAKVKLRSRLYDILDQSSGFGLADLLASFALFDDDPALVNRLEGEIEALTPELLQRAAREVLRKTNRTVLLVEPKGAP